MEITLNNFFLCESMDKSFGALMVGQLIVSFNIICESPPPGDGVFLG